MKPTRSAILQMAPLNQSLYLHLLARPIVFDHPEFMADGTAVNRRVTVVGVNTGGPKDHANKGLYVRDVEGNVTHLWMSNRELMVFFSDHEEKTAGTPDKDPEPFTRYIFMGSGEYSRAAVDQAREHLDWVFEMLGGEQQPRTCWEPEASPEEVLFEEGMRKKRLAVVRGLVLAMGAEEILKDG